MLSAFPAFFLPPVSSDSAEDATKLVWVLRLRWVALSAQALCIFPALAYRLLEPRLLPRFLGVIAALTVLNLLTWNSVRKDRPARAHTYRLLIQLSFDIAALSTLLGLTGGARNPMIPLLFVHAGIGALLLPRRQSSLLFSLLLGALVLLQAFAHIPPGLQGIQVPSKILFPAQALVALVFWILTIWLSSTLSSLRQESTRAREHKTRIDRLRAVGALAAGLCHEFATPLNTAQLKLARLQRREDLGDDVDLETAIQALDQCQEILRHTADAPLRPESLVLEESELGSLVERVSSSVSEANPGISIQVSIRGDRPHRALLPIVAFSQALIYLFDNALESAGTEQPIEAVVESRPGEIDIAVLDRGRGWPDVVRDHLGQPFVTTKQQGVGLGLYYVHTLAEAIGGSFHVANREGGGAIARISLRSIPAS